MHLKQFRIILFLYIGLIVVLSSLVAFRKNATDEGRVKLAFAIDRQNMQQITPNLNTYSLDLPKSIDFLEQKHSVGVVEGVYDYEAQKWSITDEHAHFATNTSLPTNNTGSAVIYGHNSKQIFSVLYELKIGNTVMITTASDETIYYVVVAMKSVKPDDVRVLNQLETPTLVLITCEGAWNQSRKIIYLNKIITNS